jgi:hypothetical protein
VYCAANEFDLYREWALAVCHGRVERQPSCRYACGMIALRPDRDGRLAGYEDVNDAEGLARDPTMRAIVGREGLARVAASSSQIGLRDRVAGERRQSGGADGFTRRLDRSGARAHPARLHHP